VREIAQILIFGIGVSVPHLPPRGWGDGSKKSNQGGADVGRTFGRPHACLHLSQCVNDYRSRRCCGSVICRAKIDWPDKALPAYDPPGWGNGKRGALSATRRRFPNNLSERRTVTVRFRCRVCGKQFNERSGGILNRAQGPSDVIALVVFWRLRYKLSLRDLPEMFLIRGIKFSYEAVRDWETKLTRSLIDSLRRRRKGRIGKSWYVDETYIKVNGHWCYLGRAIDRFGGLVDVRLSATRDMEAAKAFF
jgi:DDE domain